MGQQGQLVKWNDERGFGFIQGGDGRQHFVHISQIGRIATRPRIGDRVTFVPGFGRDGRAQARSVRILGANPVMPAARHGAAQATGSWMDWRFPLAALLGCLLAVGVVSATIPLLLGVAYAAIGVVSFSLYSADKYFAQSNQWRTSEAMLLGFDLGFGAIGGLLAQAIYRHKTRKGSYQAMTLLISSVHLIWLAGMAFGLIDTDTLSTEINDVLDSLGFA